MHCGFWESGEKPERPRHCNRDENVNATEEIWEGAPVGRTESQETCPQQRIETVSARAEIDVLFFVLFS